MRDADASARGIWDDEGGQSSVEYAVVLFAFIAIIVALGALVRFGRAGALLERAVESSSHALGGLGGMQDILLF